jgi:hypothetical protein
MMMAVFPPRRRAVLASNDFRLVGAVTLTCLKKNMDDDLYVEQFQYSRPESRLKCYPA